MEIPNDILEQGIGLTDQYFDLKGLEAYSALSVSKLRDHISGSGLPSYRVGGKILVKRSEFDTWMAQFRHHKGKDVKEITKRILDNLRKESDG